MIKEKGRKEKQGKSLPVQAQQKISFRRRVNGGTQPGSGKGNRKMRKKKKKKRKKA